MLVLVHVLTAPIILSSPLLEPYDWVWDLFYKYGALLEPKEAAPGVSITKGPLGQQIVARCGF